MEDMETGERFANKLSESVRGLFPRATPLPPPAPLPPSLYPYPLPLDLPPAGARHESRCDPALNAAARQKMKSLHLAGLRETTNSNVQRNLAITHSLQMGYRKLLIFINPVE